MAEVIGFMGCHNSGKTTLKDEVAKKLEERGKRVLTPDFSVTEIAKTIRTATGAPINEEQRIHLQNVLYEEWFKTLYAINYDDYDYIVYDRTPMDFAMYSLADTQMSSPFEYCEWVDKYAKKCLDDCGKVIDHIYLMTIADYIPIEEREGRGFLGRAYMLMIDSVGRGLFHMIKQKTGKGRHIETETVEDRVKEVLYWLEVNRG